MPLSAFCHRECVRARTCVCIQRIYIWPEGEAGSTLVLERAFVRARAPRVCKRGSVVPAVLLFGTAHRVNPGQCVVKKPYVRARLSARRSGKKRAEKGGGVGWKRAGWRGGRKEGDANVHGVLRARTHAHTRRKCIRDADDRRTLASVAKPGLRLPVAVRSFPSEFCARREFSIFFPLFSRPRRTGP